MENSKRHRGLFVAGAHSLADARDDKVDNRASAPVVPSMQGVGERRTEGNGLVLRKKIDSGNLVWR